MDLAVVGDGEFVTGFRLAGVQKVYEINEESKLEETVKGIFNDSSIGILVMHSNDFDKLPETLRDTLSESVEPTLVTLGGTGQSSNLRDKIKQAVGVDLWK
ncbi:V-type ATP synthase subunit F [Methanohalophilus portucalensis]|jgi:V/A-type H+-transporting ATPase subunit F|uniref:A-type ATP synthase subunit F n=2 Tax=Methanohalophilus portucalensis TaxID=39664 RepID=A0A1L9C4E2_9EURY|nr:V-type ATP synthase subunit F [Methanohalophilus portucalensis]ATU07783.1 V-type ATP synthase subunit F [Methanohalophilus portucalensis]OJH49399.1 Vacuolar H+ transporting two-sector ATPase F subunit [Methanohalophilus portucalensis FDF-1]RNI11496.1 V-type ATP synthase subunit F [Methanohalophilus portucalensis FDF-1]SMH41155.1 V/A-type H+-transporting ATPase subunit F [Methanohalophilus portucalensis FDF-1]